MVSWRKDRFEYEKNSDLLKQFKQTHFVKIGRYAVHRWFWHAYVSGYLSYICTTIWHNNLVHPIDIIVVSWSGWLSRSTTVHHTLNDSCHSYALVFGKAFYNILNVSAKEVSFAAKNLIKDRCSTHSVIEKLTQSQKLFFYFFFGRWSNLIANWPVYYGGWGFI